jgi:hypothetical protein
MENQSKPQPTTPKYEDIAERAYQIWEDEGQPHGKDEEHWQRAEEELRRWHSPVPPEGEAGLPPAA